MVKAMARRQSYTEREIYSLVHSEKASSLCVLPSIAVCLWDLVFQQKQETDGKRLKDNALSPPFYIKTQALTLQSWGRVCVIDP